MTDFSTFDLDGRSVRFHRSQASDPKAPGVVILHAWWGLNADVVGYADRLSSAGFHVIAPDLFDGAVASTVEEAERLVRRGDEAAEGISLAAIDHLAEQVDPGAGLGVLGFSFGAAYAIYTPSERPRLTASVAYYGTYTGPFLSRSTAPFLGHFAESDPYEPADGVRELEDGLRAAGRETTIHVYPGTGHWFAEPSQPAYRPEAADLAFERTVAFLGRHLRRGG
ncbi:MAG TPA: dienelactone hydrolase family protein [Candidatus Limnocylindrales bacterium]|nr:dienelactone hydrolase family protein [Candidatus Limnocylindrales bacterium]